ncbi:MAG: hypothetical protein K2Q07_05460 [Burkholderiaceae bacterium]|nr:hypothetical protein [Burkholderiaceae bacterium]
MRVVFPYFAQLHQVFHSLPIAAEMALRHPDVEVHVAAATPAHRDFIWSLLQKHAPAASVRVDALSRPWLKANPGKKKMMAKNLRYLRSFDAIVVPERTSLFMRQLGLGNTRLIWTRHGAGDRAVGFSTDVHQFDFVLVAGRKIERRLLTAGLIRPGHYLSGVYAKFDWMDPTPTRNSLFENDRPTVLYNPHFHDSFSSWNRHGLDILKIFASSTQYNLIFAPHIRLFDPPSDDKYKPFEIYRRLPHIHIDLGSPRGTDMTYINAADMYLGDVSSQVAEFVTRPRPCLFINAHAANWQNNPDYEFWKLGPVIDGLDDFHKKIEAAFSSHTDYLPAQRQYAEETFGIMPGEASAARGADAIVDFLSGRASPCAAASAP